ncbi:MAG: hypothetical protein IT369_05170 [Candidatus Latescibacteria bacterium]|nr:hypothetical protein [Candidatus Latescibacterota bacterium]
MKKYILAGAVMALAASQVQAQITIPTINIPMIAGVHPAQYDPFWALPGKAGTMGADVGLANGDLSAIGDASDVFVMGKYSVNDKIEVGARATLGFLAGDNADAFRSVVAGAKYGLGEKSALGVNLLVPVGEAEDPGLSIAYMQNMATGGINWNNQFQVGLLDGYAAKGINLHLFLEPNKAFGAKAVGYLDIIVNTNTDDIGGDPLGINLAPNVDYKLNDKMTLNAGVSLGLAGDGKQADPGIGITLLYLCAK